MDRFTISTDKSRLDRAAIFDYLKNRSYWGQSLSEASLERAIENSVCFGVYENTSQQQVGFARVITDFATFAYLCDVFILESHQGNGLGKQLIREIEQYLLPFGCRSWALKTRDAHGLYEHFGFSLAEFGHWMARKFPTTSENA